MTSSSLNICFQLKKKSALQLSVCLANVSRYPICVQDLGLEGNEKESWDAEQAFVRSLFAGHSVMLQGLPGPACSLLLSACIWSWMV